MSNLILYPKGERTFDTNGIGILSDAIDATVIEELNGQFELEVQYPLDGIHFGDIVNEAIITAEVYPGSGHKPFDIYRIKKTSKSAVTIWARTPAYRCRKIVASPFAASSAPEALQGLETNAVNDCPFEFWTDITTGAEIKVAVPTDIWKLMGSSQGCILSTYGGEYEFDGFTVKLHSRRGMDRGVSIRYGKNLTSVTQDENCTNCYTSVYPYWTDQDGNLLQLPEKLVSAPGNHSDIKILPLNLSQEFDAKPTAEQLRERAEKYIVDNDIGKPEISWTVEFVQLEQTEEYKGKALLERVYLGDTVSVVFPKMGVDVSARAVSRRYKPVLGRHQSITLGSVKKTLADTIVKQQQAIDSVASPSFLQNAVNKATQWITGGGGYMVAVRDAAGNWQEICSLDTPDIATAVNVWRWNNGGLGHSSRGYNGPFNIAITQDGHIVADFITTGTLDAAVVKVVNLVAERLKSIKNGYELNLDGASMIMSANGEKTLQIEHYDALVDEITGETLDPVLVRIYLDRKMTDGTYQHLLMAPDRVALGDWNFPEAALIARRIPGQTPLVRTKQGSRLLIDEIEAADSSGNDWPFKFLGKNTSWKRNSDGTYALVGTD